MFKRLFCITGWMNISIKLNLFIAILAFLLFMTQKGAFAASTEIVATISPVRYVYLDSSNSIIRIDSNSSSLDNVQLYWVNQSGIPLNHTAEDELNYKSLVRSIDLTKTGTVYLKPKSSGLNKFFLRLESKLPIFSKLFLF